MEWIYSIQTIPRGTIRDHSAASWQGERDFPGSGRKNHPGFGHSDTRTTCSSIENHSHHRFGEIMKKKLLAALLSFSASFSFIFSGCGPSTSSAAPTPYPTKVRKTYTVGRGDIVIDA